MANVLLVENDIKAVGRLKPAILKWGYQVLTAENAQEALDHLAKNECDLIVSPWLLPDCGGSQFCQKVRSLARNRRIYIIIIGEARQRSEIVRNAECGVDDFVAKPVDHDELIHRLEIATRISKLERENDQKYLVIKKNYFQSIQMFTQLLETYNRGLGGHARRVGQFALSLAKKHPAVLPEDYPIIEAAGMLHDIGLIGLSETLVTKSVPEMNGDEKKDYYAHPQRGELILGEVDLLRPVAKIVRWHHEQANGRGFPDGLNEKQIPIAAAVVSAASVYDHLIHHQKIQLERIPEQLQPYRGYQFSPQIVDLLLELNLEQIQAEAKRNYMEIEIDALQSGMILADDVRMRTGAFVMAANTSIDAAVIEKLKRYHELGNIGSIIFIKK
jgi:putative two-component system response regulator